MPTGYTYYIENGDVITGKEFLKKCIREFGCCIGQRDDPLSDPLICEIKPNSYYKEAYEKAITQYEDLKNMSSEEIRNAIKSDREKELDYKEKRIVDLQILRNKYLSIKEDVEKWIPPTPDHNGIKKFALDQIDISIPTEKEIDELKKKIRELKDKDEIISELDIGKYIIEQSKFLERDIEYYRRLMLEEEDRAKKRTEFIKTFLSSL